ncbi:MAG: hypothetical protein EOO90_29025 [Pedobacter sp.]|nr:MAG: hypothetical protein EOO90_29025 [Pedobacter sp.]
MKSNNNATINGSPANRFNRPANAWASCSLMSGLESKFCAEANVFKPDYSDCRFYFWNYNEKPQWAMSSI